MAKKQNKILGWIKGVINGADEKLAKLVKTDLEPKMLSVIGFSLIASLVVSVIAIVCQAAEVHPNVIMAVWIIGAVAIYGYMIKMLLPNINLIKPVGMKIIYVALNFAAVFIAGLLAGYALSAVIFLVVAYIVLMLVLGGFGNDGGSGEKDHLGRKHVATLDNGVKIYKGRDMTMNSYYTGSDGNSYEPCGGGFRKI